MGRDKLPPHVRVVRVKGRPYYYFERFRGTGRAEKRIRLPDDSRAPEFWTAYAAAANLAPQPINASHVRHVIDAWHASPEWKALAPKTSYEWSRYCDRINQAWGGLEIQGIEPRHVLALRDHYAATPAAANNLLRCLSSLMGWSVPRGYRATNPCREVRELPAGDGYPPWTWEAIEEARGFRPELWWFVALALYTGQRRGDVLAMRWDAMRSGMVSVRQEKTGKTLFIPIHRDLAAVIETIPRRAVTVLTTQNGRPWTGHGFSASWRKVVPDSFKDRGLVLHGLRKSAVCMLLEAGCTDAEVSAITGQSREMVAHYSRQVNQAKLAASAILRWENAR